MNITGATSVKWSEVSASNTVLYSSPYDPNDITFYLFANGEKALFKLDATNACGTTTNEFAWVASNCSGNPCGGEYSLSPNPTASNLNVVTNITAPCNLGAAMPPDSLLIAQLNIYDQNGVLKTQATVGGTTQASINVGTLSTGTYILEIKATKGYAERQKFIKQ
jgi:hypothetical protein